MPKAKQPHLQFCASQLCKCGGKVQTRIGGAGRSPAAAQMQVKCGQSTAGQNCSKAEGLGGAGEGSPLPAGPLLAHLQGSCALDVSCQVKAGAPPLQIPLPSGLNLQSDPSPYPHSPSTKPAPSSPLSQASEPFLQPNKSSVVPRRNQLFPMALDAGRLFVTVEFAKVRKPVEAWAPASCLSPCLLPCADCASNAMQSARADSAFHTCAPTMHRT